MNGPIRRPLSISDLLAGTAIVAIGLAYCRYHRWGGTDVYLAALAATLALDSLFFCRVWSRQTRIFFAFVSFLLTLVAWLCLGVVAFLLIKCFGSRELLRDRELVEKGVLYTITFGPFPMSHWLLHRFHRHASYWESRIVYVPPKQRNAHPIATGRHDSSPGASIPSNGLIEPKANNGFDD